MKTKAKIRISSFALLFVSFSVLAAKVHPLPQDCPCWYPDTTLGIGDAYHEVDGDRCIEYYDVYRFRNDHIVFGFREEQVGGAVLELAVFAGTSDVHPNECRVEVGIVTHWTPDSASWYNYPYYYSNPMSVYEKDACYEAVKILNIRLRKVGFCDG